MGGRAAPHKHKQPSRSIFAFAPCVHALHTTSPSQTCPDRREAFKASSILLYLARTSSVRAAAPSLQYEVALACRGCGGAVGDAAWVQRADATLLVLQEELRGQEQERCGGCSTGRREA